MMDTRGGRENGNRDWRWGRGVKSGEVKGADRTPGVTFHWSKALRRVRVWGRVLTCPLLPSLSLTSIAPSPLQ